MIRVPAHSGPAPHISLDLSKPDILNSMDTPQKDTPQVIIYSSPTCGFCHMAMDYLKDKGVAYTERDISVDREALEFVMQKIGQAVTPIITFGDTIIVGFDRPKIDAAIAAMN